MQVSQADQYLKLGVAYISEQQTCEANSLRFLPGLASISPAMLDQFEFNQRFADVKMPKGLACPRATHLTLQLVNRTVLSQGPDVTLEQVILHLTETPQLVQITDLLMVPAKNQICYF